MGHPLGHQNVVIGGKEFKLVPSLDGIAEAEARAGMGIYGIGMLVQIKEGKQAITGLTAKHIVGLLYGGHYGADPEKAMNYKDFSDLCIGHSLSALLTPALQFLNTCTIGASSLPMDKETLPESEEDKKKP